MHASVCSRVLQYPYMILSLIVGFLLGVAALLFALQNTSVVALTFLGWQFESSLALLVLIALAVGVLISLLVSIPSAVKDGLRIMALKKENRKLADELAAWKRPPETVVVAEEGSVLDIRTP